MGRRVNEEMKAKHANWLELMGDPEFRTTHQEEQAKVVGVVRQTIANWEKLLPQDQWDAWLQDSRKHYAKEFIKVDRALIKKAQTGDVNASELAYKRLEGWSPKSEVTNVNREDAAKSQEELEKEVKEQVVKSLSKEDLEKALEEKGLRVVDPGEAAGG